jgi:hypothetical protein
MNNIRSEGHMPEKNEMYVRIDEEYDTVYFEMSKDYAREVLEFDENNIQLWAQFGKLVRENILRNNDVAVCIKSKGARN